MALTGMRPRYVWPDAKQYDQRPWRVFTREEVMAMPVHETMFNVPLNVPCLGTYQQASVRRHLETGEPFEFLYLWRPKYNTGHKARGLCE